MSCTKDRGFLKKSNCYNSDRKYMHRKKDPAYLYDDYDCLMQLMKDEKFIKRELTFNVDGFVKKMQSIKQSTKNARLEKKLNAIFCTFRHEALKEPMDSEPDYKKKMNKTIKRLSTPTATGFDEFEDQRKLSILALQKTIRGRIVQKSMREDIKNNLVTLQELKTLKLMDPNGIKSTIGEAIVAGNIYGEQLEFDERENEFMEVTEQMEGEIIGKMMEFLDKEMIRLLDERKVHALMTVAEKERRTRETGEAGNRQKYEENQRTNDEIYKQIVGINQSTADMYLENLYLETIQRAAEESATHYIQELSRAKNKEAYRNPEAEENQAAELVYKFILPEINRIEDRAKNEQIMHNYINAAFDLTNFFCDDATATNCIANENENDENDVISDQFRE